MTENQEALEISLIKADGSVRDDCGINLFRVETPDGPFWFEANYHYAPRGEFTVTVRNFGLWRSAAAGSTTPLVRRVFSASQARDAEHRLKAFFMGPPDNPDLPFLPFRVPKARCAGVDFATRSITVRYDASVREADDAYDMLLVEAPEASFWIELDYRFTGDGGDFRVRIRRVILRRQLIRIPPRHGLSEALAVRVLVKRFFLGRGAAEPFRIGSGRCLGVSFARGWISIAPPAIVNRLIVAWLTWRHQLRRAAFLAKAKLARRRR